MTTSIVSLIGSLYYDTYVHSTWILNTIIWCGVSWINYVRCEALQEELTKVKGSLSDNYKMD